MTLWGYKNMVEVEMSDDIRKYETKTAGPFTTRQLVFLVIAFIYALPIAIMVPIAIEYKILVAILLATPCILCGYVKMDGVNFEILVLRMIYLYFLTPAKRKQIVKNPFREELKKIKKQEEDKKIAAMTAKQRKKYIKEQKKKKQVHYSKNAALKIYK